MTQWLRVEGPEFGSQHLCQAAQKLPVTPDPGDTMPLGTHMHVVIYTHSYTLKIKHKINLKQKQTLRGRGASCLICQPFGGRDRIATVQGQPELQLSSVLALC